MIDVKGLKVHFPVKGGLPLRIEAETWVAQAKQTSAAR